MHPIIRVLLQAAALVKAMRISTSTSANEDCYFYKDSIVVSTKTTGVKFTTKVETSKSDHAQVVLIRNGSKQATLALKSGSIICNYLGTSPFTYSVDTSVYHEYEVRMEGTTQATFYVDGTLIHTATYANLLTSAANSIFWGDGYSAGGGSVVWRSFLYNLDYVANPANYVAWDPSSLPSAQGWTAGGTTTLATIIDE